jgi:dTDP-glucose 4,6-dehydratase
MISLFGKGFIGTKFYDMYKDITYIEPRDSTFSKYNEILYLRGTNSNYNVFSDPTLDIKVNLLLFTETLKNLTPNHNFTLISSWFTYFPRGFYSATKLCQEQLLESYCKTFHIPFKILRLSNIIGKDSRASAKKNALEFMINKIKNNEDIQLYEGDNYRNFLDVKTCCEAIRYVMVNGENGQTYNIGASESYKVGDLLQYCIEKTKSKSKINMIETPEFHKICQARDFWMDTGKLRDLGFNNQINICKTLDNLL